MHDVLVVDDDLGIRTMISAVLTMDGIPHRLASDGAEALQRVAEAPPGLVLLDFHMPVLDGAGFCRTLHAEGRRDDLPIVVMTAGADALRFARECGAEGHLSKPFDMDALLATVARFGLGT